VRPATLSTLLAAGGLAAALALRAPALAHAADDDDNAGIADSTWVDHDRQAIAQPPDWQPSYWGKRFHQAVLDPLAHLFDVPDKLLWGARVLGADTRREAVDVNAYDEAPNSAWFTNRNSMRAVPVEELRAGPDEVVMPDKPWTIKHAKRDGVSVGFQIKDAAGKTWLVKLDTRNDLQLSSGADMVARTLIHAAGYNVPHNESVRFTRADLVLDPPLLTGAKGEWFTAANLDSALAHGATFADGTYSACASRFVAGHALGSPAMSRARPEDSNDWYAHVNRRELRGLFVVCSWVGNWDTEDHQFLDSFVTSRDSLGHVVHYVLDSGSSFGASASGPKMLSDGYEYVLDFGWIARRFVTLGFVEEPWRRAHQETGLPSLGYFESDVYTPQRFKPGVPMPAFRLMTDRDGYWGAKIVASFSNEQIAAAVDAAHYEDPRATAFLVRNLIVRRDKIARHWFGRVAPLDFFSVTDGVLNFHDLAVDIGLARARNYDVEVDARGAHAPTSTHLKLTGTAIPLPVSTSGSDHLAIELSIAGNGAKSTEVELTRRDATWSVTRVRHG
jgi:hypothetical protein